MVCVDVPPRSRGSAAAARAGSRAPTAAPLARRRRSLAAVRGCASRETAPQAERWSGIHLVIAHSFAPIHERNNLNLGQLLGTYEQLERLQRGEEIPVEEFTGDYDPVTKVMVESGGLFPFAGV